MRLLLCQSERQDEMTDNNDARDEKLDFWIKHGMNVILIGKPGDGKTGLVKSAFNRNSLNWRYFSACTDHLGSRYLDLVVPGAFADDSIEAIFFDDFDRAPKEVRNVVMELVQFGSIHCKPFPNLRIVWAAINPQVEGVERLNPALIDRFHVHVEMS